MNRSDFFIDDRVNVSFMYVGVSSWRLEGTTKTPAGKAKSCMEITSGSVHSSHLFIFRWNWFGYIPASFL